MKLTLIFDVECYRNFFLVSFKCVETGKVVSFERSARAKFDYDRLERLLRSSRIVGFNSRDYDMPMVALALSGMSCAELKEASDRIILGNLKPWDIEREYEVTVAPKWLDHIDIIEVAPGKASLKLYGGRLHCRRMQDLPIKPDARLTEDQMDEILRYNINDLDTTIDLWNALAQQIGLREKLGQRYGIDLRSKSDAQIAEAVIGSELERLSGRRPERPVIAPGTLYRYRTPKWMAFRTRQLKDILRAVEDAAFVVSDTGKIVMPKALEDAKIKIGTSVYRMGIGGLHSSEKQVAHRSDDEFVLLDRDVTSYYPAIILNLGLYPKHLGPDFLDVYQTIVDQRVAAKKADDKVTAGGLKITVNGAYGKLGSKWSKLYSPDLMIQVTLTGQLALLMLIEELECNGIPVVSGNTDGVVIKAPRDRLDDVNEIIAWWEQETGFRTEETRYLALYSRDVNNYVAVKDDGSAKLKGAYAEPGFMKNPANRIAVTAAVNRIVHGTPVTETVFGCRDIRQFLTIRTVKGGAVKGDRYLGKAVRWAYGRGETGTINYASNGNTVARSLGAIPVMELPDTLPGWIDHFWYIREAYDILDAIGFREPPNDPLWEMVS